MFFCFEKIRLYPKKILKNEVNINKDKTIIWEFSLIILGSSLTGKNPPEEINVKAKFKESKDLIEKIFNMIKIKSVRLEYKKNILTACFNIYELLKEI